MQRNQGDTLTGKQRHRGTELSLEVVLDTGPGVSKPGEAGRGDTLGRTGQLNRSLE